MSTSSSLLPGRTGAPGGKLKCGISILPPLAGPVEIKGYKCTEVEAVTCQVSWALRAVLPSGSVCFFTFDWLARWESSHGIPPCRSAVQPGQI